ncbi:PROTEIN GRAVITROPIC IN THE LIGHT 1 [Salix purpurea]|uniref:PROTEIN GRAVITROPIC IN THE LIGHT 1 n=2 Tax=Salix TaxID=40685 RepID=A0A9Q0WBH3_SALPP|nr:PROTEIN GRAVITROPIC IN THE LIGHT 1 [Salix purpurea]
MEHVTNKLSKPSSNISEMVSKFAKVCKLRSIGVFSNDHHYQHNLIGNNDSLSMGEDSSDATEETEFHGEKIHPQPVVVPMKSNMYVDKDIAELFDTVSALKLAYVQLQEAHIPYDPDNIVAADELVVAQLEALCKSKKAFKEKQFSKTKLDPSRSDSRRSEIDVIEKLLEKMKSQDRDKDAEILRLRQELHDLDSGNAVLVEKIKEKSLERRNVRILNVSMFEDTFKRASKAIHDFARPIISLMQASGWDLNLAADSIENGVVYGKRSDKKYAFEAYIARRMFNGMPLRSYDVDDVLRYDDPINSLIDNPKTGFANFCREKYMLAVHPMMEMSFFRNLDQRMFILSGRHPRTPFYQIFARMAKWVWILQGIATSIDPNAQMFSVHRGSEFSDVYLEPVQEEGVVVSKGEQSNFKVEFMVMPGFRIGSTLVKSRAYLSETKHPAGT